MGRRRQMQMMKHVSDTPQDPLIKRAVRKKGGGGGGGPRRGNLFGAVLSFVRGGDRKRRNKSRGVGTTNNDKGNNDGSPFSQASFFSGGTSVSGGVSASSSPGRTDTVSPPTTNVGQQQSSNRGAAVVEDDECAWNTRGAAGGDPDGSNRSGSGHPESGAPPSYKSLCLPRRLASSGARCPITAGRAYQGHILSRGSHKLVSPASRIGGGGSGKHEVPSKMPQKLHGGPHPSAADVAVLRAAIGGHLSATEKAPAEVTPKTKMSMHDMEKMFIRSLAKVDDAVWAEKYKNDPPLLGQTPRPQWYGPLAGPHAAVTAAADKGHFGAGSMVVPLGPKKTLVLDLDETLVSSSRTPCTCDYKIVFKIHYKEPPSEHASFAGNGDAPAGGGGGGQDVDDDGSDEEMVREICYYVRLRPGLQKFLQKAAALYELVIWTASGKSYADAIIDLLDPHKTLFSKRLYRESCERHRGLCVKDLRRLGRPMDSVMLLDNYVYSFGLTLDNGVPILPWTGTEGAKEPGLMIAYTLLKRIAKVSDIRTPLIKAFDLHRKVHGARPPSPVPSLDTALTSTATTPQSQSDTFSITNARGSEYSSGGGGRNSPKNGFRSTSPRVSSPRVGSSRVSSPRVSSPRVSSPRVSSPRVSSPRVGSSRVSSPRVSSPRVSSPRVSPPRASPGARRGGRRRHGGAGAAGAAERACRQAAKAAARAEAEAISAESAAAIAMNVGRTGEAAAEEGNGTGAGAGAAEEEEAALTE